MKEEDLTHGAIVYEAKPQEDYILATSGIPVDWNIGFEVGMKLKAKNQFNSYACGGFACSYYKQVLEGKDVQSPKFIYANTFSKPSGGSSYEALGAFLCKYGSCDEDLCPSFLPDGTTNERFITNKLDITEWAYKDGYTNRSDKYAKAPSFDIDTIAQIIRDYNGCIIGVFGKNNGSWTSDNPMPPVGKYEWAHWVMGVGFGMYKGKKGIKIINSWGDGVGEHGYQWLTEEYFPNGIFIAWDLTEKPIIPKYIFEKTIRFGERSNEVKQLQKRLAEEGYNQPITGYYGPVTALNILAYQRKHKVASEGELFNLGGRLVGPKTIKQLNATT